MIGDRGAGPVLEGEAADAADSASTVECLMRTGLRPLEPSDRLAAAAARMRAAQVGVLTVVEDGELIGLLTERDLLRAVADGLSTDVTLVREYMRPVPCAIRADAAASVAAARMMELRVRHLPVVRDSLVVGMVSADDVLRQWGVPPELLIDEGP